MLWRLFEWKPFLVMMLVCLVFLYIVGWAWLIPGTIILLFLIKVLYEMPDGAGLAIGYLSVFSLILFFIPLVLVLINLWKN